MNKKIDRIIADINKDAISSKIINMFEDEKLTHATIPSILTKVMVEINETYGEILEGKDKKDTVIKIMKHFILESEDDSLYVAIEGLPILIELFIETQRGFHTFVKVKKTLFSWCCKG